MHYTLHIDLYELILCLKFTMSSIPNILVERKLHTIGIAYCVTRIEGE